MSVNGVEEVLLHIDARTADRGIVRRLSSVVREHPGQTPVKLWVQTSQGWRCLLAGLQVTPSPRLAADLIGVLGQKNVAYWHRDELGGER